MKVGKFNVNAESPPPKKKKPIMVRTRYSVCSQV